MINFVIFDVDGTLVDSVDLHAEAWRRTFEKFGKKIEYKIVRDQIGKGGDQLLPVFFSEDELKQFGKEMEKARGELFKSEYLERVKPFPQARELVKRIFEDGKEIVLASSAVEDELAYFKKILEIDEFLTGETNADDSEKSKPHPDIFLAALDELGNPAVAEAIVIGDAPYDAIAARKADLKTIGVLSGGFDREWLEREGCVEIYNDPADLLARYDASILANRAKQAAK